MPRYGRSVRFWVWEHFSNVPSDVVGRIFQNLIGPEERHRYGQHFTGDGGVDLINTFCIRSGRGAVLDPAWPTARPFRRAFHPPRSGHGYGSTGGFSAKCTKLKREPQAVCCPPRRRATRSRSAPVSVNALIRSSPGISSGKLANLANSVSEKIEAGTAVSSDWSRGFPSLSLRYRL